MQNSHANDPIYHLRKRGYRYALTLTRDPDRAEDLVQEAWLATLQAEGPMAFGYLCHAIRSRYVDGGRRATRRPQEVAELDKVSDDSRNALRLERRSELRAAAAALKPSEQELLYMSVVEGLTASEIGELQGRPRGTILSLLHRARHKARQALLVMCIAVTIGGATWWSLSGSDETPSVAAYVADHHIAGLAKTPSWTTHRYDALPVDVRRLGFQPVAPQHPTTNLARLEGGSYCSVAGQKAVQLRLRDRAGQLVTLYQTLDSSEVEHVPDGAWIASNVLVTTWRRDGVLFALAETSALPHLRKDLSE